MVRPNNVLIISLKTDSCDKSLDEIADMQLRIKMINWYTEKGKKGHSSLAYLFLFFPILYLTSLHNELFKNWEKHVKSAFHQIFIGNKFYLYSVVQLNDTFSGTPKENEPYFEHALYGLGKLIDVDTMLDPGSYFYPNLDYYHKVMNDNVLKLYDNWKALALNETFTVLCGPTLGLGELEEMVTSRYKLFVNVVYQKSFIFYENMYFQNETISQKMEDEILEFNRYFNITLPTYNEVPLMFYRKMREAMEVEQVYEVLSEKITTSTNRQSERRERSFNAAVGFLAVLAIFSAVIDYISILKELLKSHSISAWWIVVFILIFVLVTFGLFRLLQRISVSQIVINRWNRFWKFFRV
jgi:CRISPR/Cas system CSM-associated protein Csm2 small subunit